MGCPCPHRQDITTTTEPSDAASRPGLSRTQLPVLLLAHPASPSSPLAVTDKLAVVLLARAVPLQAAIILRLSSHSLTCPVGSQEMLPKARVQMLIQDQTPNRPASPPDSQEVLPQVSSVRRNTCTRRPQCPVDIEEVFRSPYAHRNIHRNIPHTLITTCMPLPVLLE